MPVCRVAAALAIAAALAGCSATSTPPGPSPSIALADACSAAAEAVVHAAAEVVAGYAPLAVEASGGAPADPPSDPPADPLGPAVEAAVAQRDRLGCNASLFRADIEAGLGEIEPEGALAAAVHRRVSASILGTGRTDAGEWALAAGADLHDALARAAEGTTLVLPAGTWELDETLVVLDAVVLRGAGSSATILRSTAAEAAVVVATASPTWLEGIAIELVGTEPASGVVGGPNASLGLTDVRVSGAVAGEAGEGGAGVFLSAQGEEGSGRGTTLEVTDSLLEGNAWAGIAVSGGHRVSVESTAFVGNGEVGMLFLDASSGSVRSSTFTDNAVGLAASGTATPAWIESTVTGGDVGAQLDGSAAASIEGLSVSGAASAAVIFGGSSGGAIDASTCADVPYGVVIGDGAAPTLGDNDCVVSRGLS